MASTIAAGTSAGTAIAISGDTSGSLQLQTNGTTTAVTIDTSQNVGIGTSSPAAKLNVGRAGTIGVLTGVNAVFNADSNNQYGGIQINSYDDNTKRFAIINSNGITSLFGYGSNSSVNLGTDSAQPVLISTNNTERMRIDSSGNLLVGTTTAAPTAPFNGTAVAGVFRTIATSGSVTNGGNTTLFTITVDTVYLVTVQTQNASGLSTTAIVRYVTGGNPVATTTLYADNAGFAVTVSGTAVRITNNLGGNVAFTHSSVRIY